MGWMRSAIDRKPVDATGAPLPWYTYPAISFLIPRIKASFEVFEFGSGNSTLWWAARVKNVTSVEHNKMWFEQMSELVPANVQYIFADLESGDYVKTLGTQAKEFDIVVIDGRNRVLCAKETLSRLNSGGVIVWDNSDRDRYVEGYDFLHGNGFKRIDFSGLGPINKREWMTSIFYRPGNCLDI